MIGILTFHWATNYGAVLQSYALQQFLIRNGVESRIINYIPWSVILQQQIDWRKNKSKNLFNREKNLEVFRETYLKRTKRINRSKKLKKLSNDFETVICGSDQIWNPAFTLHGEFKPTLAYFADFVADDTKRVSYAASFGVDDVDLIYQNVTMPELKKFASISVREISGIKIIEKMGLKATAVCDPTLLLLKDDYLRFVDNKREEYKTVFSYVLHNNTVAHSVAQYVESLFKVEKLDTSEDYENQSIERWISSIYYSRFVVTNSFHGVMVSLLLNKPFIVVLIKNSGMNDRIETILSSVGLKHRMIDNYDEELIKRIAYSQVEWDEVNNLLDAQRKKGQMFILEAIRNGKS